ncbi:helix-turn-helix domain-containing protein [Cytobacillus oceanisediminis]|uniref:helix-turn-helix domain-containing protein n=1 Tax=Cytobacillus oceanisediminis TaxID=665099 RepID=UPI001C22E6D9|nr:helix-turn-helix transcriptional regulator [Cytobacillus oceanisediminis]MBU8770301.1 helix-turn-helix transcriptional regulator [Cytobacillus oceanisediminis]
MKIQHNLKPLMKQHDIRNLTHLSEKTEVDYRKLHSFYTYRSKKIDPDVVEGICKTFKCEIGELLTLKK